MFISIGIYPIVGIALAACLYAVFRWWLRLKCTARAACWFIVVAIMVTLLATLMQPVRIIPGDATPTLITQQTTQATTPATTPTNIVSQLHELATSNLASQPQHVMADGGTDVPSFPHPLFLIYIIGVMATLLYIAVQIGWLLWTRHRSLLEEQTNNVRIYTTDFKSPFSFGHNIFLPQSLHESLRSYVLLHERSHVRHRHFLWLLVIELMVALQWFNPFAWMLLKEMRLQQEMQVDAELMQGGVDREAYQLSLLRVCSNAGRWVLMQSAFGTSPLKWRILFMNRRIYERPSRRRMMAAMAGLLLIVVTTWGVACRSEKEKSPLHGCWTMDWIRNTSDKFEQVPSLCNNKFYANDMMLNFSWFARYGGVNMHFNFSGEQQAYYDGKMHNAKGDTLRLTWVDDDTFQERWLKDSLQTTLVGGPDITEQWHRVEPDEGVVRILQTLQATHFDDSHPVYGVWQEDVNGMPEHTTNYLVVDTYLYVRFTLYHAIKDRLELGAGGWSGDFRYISEDRVFLSDREAPVRWLEDGRMQWLMHRDNGHTEVHTYHRINHLPENFLKILQAASLN